MDTQDYGEPSAAKIIRFIRLTRDTGEIFYIRPETIWAMGRQATGSTYIRTVGSIDHVIETPETISVLMDRAGV